MDAWVKKETKCDGNEAVRPGEKDIYVQLTISLSLGLSAFLVFCVSAASRLCRERLSQMHSLCTSLTFPLCCAVPAPAMADPIFRS